MLALHEPLTASSVQELVVVAFGAEPIHGRIVTSD